MGGRVGKVRKEQQGNRMGKKWREEAKTRDEQRGDERAMGGKTKRRGETNIERNIGHGEGRESPMREEQTMDSTKRDEKSGEKKRERK